MRLLVWFMPLILIGCGMDDSQSHPFPLPLQPKNDNPSPELSIDDEFIPFYNLFINKAQEQLGKELYVKRLVIVSRNIKQDPADGTTTLGICYYSDYRIEVDPRYWNDLGTTRQAILIAHELGHCVLRRDHVEGRLSIMNPLLLSSSTFTSHEDELWKELFQPGMSLTNLEGVVR